MEVQHFGVIIKVNDLDNCRIFYRDQLGFGEPIFDSTFAAVFTLGANLTLTLEKSAAQYLEHASGAVTFTLSTSDIGKFAARMEDSGYPLDDRPVRIGIVEYRRGLDPEGNPFLVRQLPLS